MDPSFFIGSAGWSVPAETAVAFPSAGSHLARYSQVFNAVEINTSFHRPHGEATYERWAATVPDNFRFSVKLPKAVTHASALGTSDTLDQFLSATKHLGPKLGAMLAQFPPKLDFDPDAASRFFAAVRRRFEGTLVCEPRHPGWFGVHAEDVFQRFQIARVAADPAPLLDGSMPGGWKGVRYFRLHGSPRRYYSSYSHTYLTWLADELAKAPEPFWCVFDNTAAGAAVENALHLRGLLHPVAISA